MSYESNVEGDEKKEMKALKEMITEKKRRITAQNLNGYRKEGPLTG